MVTIVLIAQVVAILYMAIQTLYASKFIAVMLRCVFGHRWTDIPNRTPISILYPLLFLHNPV
jgi:NCS1 family nucleobase:cation symporter-1